MNRRRLLLSGVAIGGVLVVGWGALPPRDPVGPARLWPPADDAVALNGWIKIGLDGAVWLAMNRSEMGQGVHTALAMLVAEELDVALARVHLAPAGHDALYGSSAAFVGALPFRAESREPGHESAPYRVSRWLTLKLARELGINLTGGSASVADAWLPLRAAAATARARLLGAASLRWRLPVAELEVRDGVVSHPSGPHAHFGELAIEDMALPFFAMTSDLTDGHAKAQRSGPVWRALKASVSIPGLLPPVVIDGHLHVDGGMMNNLPVDVMAAEARGPIVAIDVVGDAGLKMSDEAYGNEGWFAAWNRMRNGAPGITSVLMRAATVGNEYHRRMARAQVDLVIDLELPGVGLTHWKKFDSIVASGYRAVKDVLERKGLPAGLLVAA